MYPNPCRNLGTSPTQTQAHETESGYCNSRRIAVIPCDGSGILSTIQNARVTGDNCPLLNMGGRIGIDPQDYFAPNEIRRDDLRLRQIRIYVPGSTRSSAIILARNTWQAAAVAPKTMEDNRQSIVPRCAFLESTLRERTDRNHSGSIPATGSSNSLAIPLPLVADGPARLGKNRVAVGYSQACR